MGPAIVAFALENISRDLVQYDRLPKLIDIPNGLIVLFTSTKNLLHIIKQ